MVPPPSPPTSWHAGPDDAFHGKITPDGPFKPEKDRYHMYIGLFCPFAQRASIVVHLKRLAEYAGISTSIARPWPKGDDKGWPGWRFNVGEGEDGGEHGENYEGATTDALFGCKFLHEIYFKADPDYTGRYSVPVLWDRQLGTIVNNESLELLRDLQTGFDVLLPAEIASLTLYPEDLRAEVDRIGEWMQTAFNRGVYKTGFAKDQATYEANLPPVFAALNKLEKLALANRGPYLLGDRMTELDVRAYATLIRFDTVYVGHFKCNLGTVRHDYPVLNNYLKNLYWNHPAFHETTDFRHIKENYTKSQLDINPRAITPVGPWPSVEKGYVEDWTTLRPGEIDMEAVLEHETKLR